MTYEQALEFWFGRINYEQRTLRMSDLKLDRMRALLEMLGNPHHGQQIIHIAGSKGKGSTAAMLACVLQKAGYRTGLFTSPHLSRVEERFQINSVPIQREDVAELMDAIAAAVKDMDRNHKDPRTRVTFFEIAAALGFMHFHRQKTDVTVLEVGLGGRFDATNVCQPLLSVITSISLDHTKQLGDNTASIAREKAGIIKRNRPVISGAGCQEAHKVVEAVCRKKNAPLLALDRDFSYRYQPGVVSPQGDEEPQLWVATQTRDWNAMKLRLLGEHQAANAALVIAAVEQLRQQGLQISDSAVTEGLLQVDWPARLEILRRRPMVVLDCAHNLASAEALLRTLETTFKQKEFTDSADNGNRQRPLRRLIFACSRDKDAAGILGVLAPYFHHAYLTCYGNNPRCVPPEQLAQILERTASLSYSVCDSAGDAWRVASEEAGPDDLICITGSVFLAGEIRPVVVGERMKQT